jgi:hypothetical protein
MRSLKLLLIGWLLWQYHVNAGHITPAHEAWSAVGTYATEAACLEDLPHQQARFWKHMQHGPNEQRRVMVYRLRCDPEGYDPRMDRRATLPESAR